MDLPLALRLSLRSGCVYYFVDSAVTSVEPHYFVVVNADPIRDEVLLLSIITSNLARVQRMRRNLPGTVVEMSPSDWPEVLTRDSAIDGNILFPRDLEGFVERWQRHEIRECARIPDHLFVKIRTAVLASPLIELTLKEQL
jgi:hypothetical protein